MSITPDNLVTFYHDERAEAKLGQQLFAIPRKNEDIINSQVFYYYVGDRRRVAVNFKNEICFHLNYLRCKSATPQQYLKMQESTTPMEDLLRADLIHPFLLFVGGYFIPWENITIICSQERYDLLIHGLPEEYFDRINGVDGIIESVYVVDLPDGIEYYQGDFPITEKTMFAFNEKGEMVWDPVGTHAYITVNDMEDYVDKIDIIHPAPVFRFADDPMYKYFPENFMTFVNNRYDPNFKIDVLATSAKVTPLGGNGDMIRLASEGDGEENPDGSTTNPGDIEGGQEPDPTPNPGEGTGGSEVDPTEPGNGETETEGPENPGETENPENPEPDQPDPEPVDPPEFSFDNAEQFGILIRCEDGCNTFNPTVIPADGITTGIVYENQEDEAHPFACNLTINPEPLIQFAQAAGVWENVEHVLIDPKLQFVVIMGYNVETEFWDIIGGDINQGIQNKFVHIDVKHYVKEPEPIEPDPDEPVIPEGHVNVQIRIFHNRKLCTPTYDNIRKVSLDAAQKDIEATLNGEDMPTYMEYLKESFDPQLDITKAYKENRDKFLDYLAYYDSMLFNKVYHSSKEVIDLEVDYLWAISHVDEDGYLKIPRRFQDGVNYYIIMMVNGELYEFYRNHFYKFGYFYCPIESLKEGDTVELLYFKHAKNFEITTRIHEDDAFLPLDQWIYGEDLRIFCKETTDEYFKFPVDGDQLFPVEFHLEYGDTRKRTLRIRFEDSFFYDKQVFLVSRKRFKYFLYNVETENQPDHVPYFTVDFGDRFKYCNEYDRYVVFYNGKRLDNDLYRIILPYRTTTPFTKAMIYLCIPIRTGDRLEVFYLPNYFVDIYAGVYADSIIDEFDIYIDGMRHRFKNIGDVAIRKRMLDHLRDPEITFPDFDAIMEDGSRAHFTYRGSDLSDKGLDIKLDMGIGDMIIPIVYKGVEVEWYAQKHNLDESGTIVIPKDKLQFALDSELCSVWVNSRKLPPSYIRNVNTTTLQVVHDLSSVQDVRVTAMIGKDELITELSLRFMDIDSLWDKACEAHGDPVTLMGIEKPNITDTDPLAFPDVIPVTAIMHEIIRDWYVANAIVDTTKPFVYDYFDVDKSDIIGKDSGGHYLLGDMDSNRTDNLDVDRPWP